MPKNANKCAMSHCDEPVYTLGLCNACYQWDYYHRKAGHGVAYMMKYGARLDRIQARVAIRVNGRRRIRLVS